jgi:hypothetical protein
MFDAACLAGIMAASCLPVVRFTTDHRRAARGPEARRSAGLGLAGTRNLSRVDKGL